MYVEYEELDGKRYLSKMNFLVGLYVTTFGSAYCRRVKKKDIIFD